MAPWWAEEDQIKREALWWETKESKRQMEEVLRAHEEMLKVNVEL